MSKTQIRQRQIVDGAINNAKIAAGAAIDLSKLANGTKIILNDGSVVMLSALQMGGFNFTGLPAASGSGQAVEYAQFTSALAALNTMFSGKSPVRVASTANVTISGPGTAIDGVILANGDRALLKNQTTQGENGIYIFNGSAAAMTRATDFDTWAEVPGMTVPVTEGTTNADTIFLSTANAGGTLGTTAITFTAVGVAAGLQTSNFIFGEVPAGAIDGSNVTFTLAFTPTVNTLRLSWNGVLNKAGSGNDYTISGNTITMLEAPTLGEQPLADYLK